MGSQQQHLYRFFLDGVCTRKKPKFFDTRVKYDPGITTTELLVTSYNHWHQFFPLENRRKSSNFNLHDRSIFFTNVCSEWAGGRTGFRAGWADEFGRVGIRQSDTALPMILTHPLPSRARCKREKFLKGERGNRRLVKEGKERERGRAKHLGPGYVTPMRMYAHSKVY